MLPQTIRDIADVVQLAIGEGSANLLREAANSLEQKDAEIWKINALLVEAGLEPYRYESMSKCLEEFIKRMKNAS